MFELKAQCNIEHVNVRRGKNDESPVAVDIKLSIDALPVNCATAALAANGDGEVQQSFFRGAEPRYPGMDVIPIDREYEGKHMVKFNELENMRVVKLFKIRLLPLTEGRFSAEFTVTIEEPTAKWLHAMAKHNNKTVDVDLQQDVRELELAKTLEPTADQKPGKVTKIKPQAEQTQPLIN